MTGVARGLIALSYPAGLARGASGLAALGLAGLTSICAGSLAALGLAGLARSRTSILPAPRMTGVAGDESWTCMASGLPEACRIAGAVAGPAKSTIGTGSCWERNCRGHPRSAKPNVQVELVHGPRCLGPNIVDR